MASDSDKGAKSKPMAPLDSGLAQQTSVVAASANQPEEDGFDISGVNPPEPTPLPQGWQQFYSLTAKQAIFALQSDAEAGLTLAEASRRHSQYGPNALAQIPKPPKWRLFLGQFNDFLVLLLIAAALVSFLIGFLAPGESESILDGAAIIAIVVLNAAFGFYQESKAEEALDALMRMTAPQARVVRDGETQEITASLLVPGDIVLVEAGDRVPADARLVEGISLSVNESALTGESQPAAKDASCVLRDDSALADTANMLFMGTTVARGRGRAVVSATGMQTQFGEIALRVQQVSREETPLQQRIEQAGKMLGQAALAIVAVVFIVGVLRGFPALGMFLIAVSLAVAAVPEGLPAIMTITLALGVQRMAGRNAVVRKLRAVETLGSADVICTDKTGTLTRNEMTVREVFFDGKLIRVGGMGYSTDGDFTLEGGARYTLTKGFSHFARAAALCTSAELEEKVGSTRAMGDPTETALLVLAAKAGIRKAVEGHYYKKLGELPFESERRMMSSVHSYRDSRYSFVKGSVEEVLANCDEIMLNGRIERLDARMRRKILERNSEMASRGLRMIAIAFKEVGPRVVQFNSRNLEEGLIFLGLAGINDPPRPEVSAAIALCRTAGIRVIMITGDNPVTAKAVGKDVGLTDDSSRVISGEELDTIGDSELGAVMEDVGIFARVSPEHKLRIVRVLKELGHTVAMTGDGVNDAPALKRADIGVAMGIAGTDVSKEASDIVLADDNFATIVNAVREGRVIYDNIVKSVHYLIACNTGELLAVFLSMLIASGAGSQIAIPLLPIQILWMNLATDGLPALALGMEPESSSVMNRPPRRREAQILSRRTGIYFLAVGAVIAAGTLFVFYNALGKGAGLQKAQTMAFATIIFMQILHAFNSRSRTESILDLNFFSNRMLLAAAGLAVGLQVIITQAGLLEFIFHTTPLSIQEWLFVTSVSITIVIASEAWKFYKKGKRQKAAEAARATQAPSASDAAPASETVPAQATASA
ncbi:calcium-translocating P-type ATPase, SERCA-type [Candidatus Micrarchaeota archaeon]|nr:calcium-translocating P-type ATPase, SERCA-type [Candidatus Micrarchaeota archaeon]